MSGEVSPITSKSKYFCHQGIESYPIIMCLPLICHKSIDENIKTQMSAWGHKGVISPRVLQGEYRRLKWQHAEAQACPHLREGSVDQEDYQDQALLAEAKDLRHHKGRLETRMQILEDHNKELESQLHRLREILQQVSLSQRLANRGMPRMHSPIHMKVHPFIVL